MLLNKFSSNLSQIHRSPTVKQRLPPPKISAHLSKHSEPQFQRWLSWWHNVENNESNPNFSSDCRDGVMYKLMNRTPISAVTVVRCTAYLSDTCTPVFVLLKNPNFNSRGFLVVANVNLVMLKYEYQQKIWYKKNIFFIAFFQELSDLETFFFFW